MVSGRAMWPVLLLTSLWLSSARGYHVLCVFPLASPSHSILAKGIVDLLLEAGHKVTWATPYPGKETKNLTYIDLSDNVEIAAGTNMADPKRIKNGRKLVKVFSRDMSESALRQEALREAVVGTQFDAVVTEWFFNEADAGYAAIQQVPWILFSSLPLYHDLEGLVDEVRSVSTHSYLHNYFPVPMNLWQRLVNSASFVNMLVERWVDSSSYQAFYEASFGPLAAARGVSLPPFASAVQNVSLLLVNSHPALMPAKSLPPNVIEVAGFHSQGTPPPLPKDLQDLLDSSPQGVIYFSMGSVMQASALPERTLSVLLRLLGEVPYTVLWKFEKELKDLPKNIHVRAWMPQHSILAHPNIKLFISHGGFLSMIEAVQFGVPMLCIPVYGDQRMNTETAIRAGFARKVTFSPDMTELQVELEEMISNFEYSKKVKQISKLFLKRPVPSSKLIAYYIELVIESKGAYHLRSTSRLYTWYQLWKLDQLAVLLGAFYLLRLLVRKVYIVLKEAFAIKQKQKKS